MTRNRIVHISLCRICNYRQTYIGKIVSWDPDCVGLSFLADIIILLRSRICLLMYQRRFIFSSESHFVSRIKFHANPVSCLESDYFGFQNDRVYWHRVHTDWFASHVGLVSTTLRRTTINNNVTKKINKNVQEVCIITIGCENRFSNIRIGISSYYINWLPKFSTR